MSQRIYRQKGARPRQREYETAADIERFEKARRARQRAMKASQQADAFIDWAIRDGR